MNLHIISTIVLVGHWLIIVGLCIRVIMRRPPVGVSLAWLAVVCSVPFVGAFSYLLFGEKRLGRKRAARIAACVNDLVEWQDTLQAQYAGSDAHVADLARPLVGQAKRVMRLPALPGNSIELLDDSESIFDRLVADIDGAQTDVHLAFYIWHEGGRVADVVDALSRASRRGVRCHALADAMGSQSFLDSASVRRLREAGVEFVAALPTGALPTVFARADLRNHRKIVVIDGRIAYSGSQNLVDPRFFKQDAGVGEWVDAMVRVTGPAAASLDGVFRFDWSVEKGDSFEAPATAGDPSSVQGGSLIQVAPSGPDLKPEAIHQLLLTAIYSARQEIVISTPYFVPDDAILTALVTAALRGVDVTLIVPARNDSFLVRHASVAHFEDLLSADVHIARFNGGLLHTKSLTVDGEICLFGSVNLDMRSLWLNFEISLLVYDRDFTGRLRALQDTYLHCSDRVDLAEWRCRPARTRFLANSCRLLGPLL